MFGFLNVCKPVDMTSHDVVSVLRRITKFKHIGHAGTLDPFAKGVLPIMFGKAARLSDYLSDEKVYVADIQFGKNTDTYDKCGIITDSFDKTIELQELEKEIKNFIGEICQRPPIYSAIKVNGKKLYEIARGNEKPDVEIPERKVVINNIKILNFDYEKQTAKIEVDCKKGTYIRSLAYDLGKNLSCGAYLTELERIVSGPFKSEQSINLDEFKDVDIIKQNMINPVQMLPQYEKIILNDKEYEYIKFGRCIDNSTISDEKIVLLVYDDNLSAIGKVDNGLIKPLKVLI